MRGISLFLLLAWVAGLGGCSAKLNTGAYARNYINLVGSNADFLVHPTGEYPRDLPQRQGDVSYTPHYRDVDNMEQAIVDMQEKGYVMIGYSAVNTRERGDIPCDPKGMVGEQLSHCPPHTTDASVRRLTR